MQDYQRIACDRYDVLELACIRRYPLLLELKDEGRIHGRAVTTETRADKSEWLLIETATSQRAIRLDRIIAITPDIEGAGFGRVLIG
ncbi:Rho-binding antiterminator [Shewanella litorisediminis]|uniref:Rho-binding antiterminator n=1 Tax=Shewanella litorisediminis TaxID=1173586 RepID=A0ABX7G2J9_9GAMM|nr:Rho-binding antiterminator [Shewanella litorisediminis]MCL2917048.1 Rho-binding antiterminator [Shewanella litorisediminis]QRH01529.1 Rho-binding antiterminator [Shewanella litorisediminis]